MLIDYGFSNGLDILRITRDINANLPVMIAAGVDLNARPARKP